ncbi:hypothetical protein FRA_35c07620 [Francisella sp. W12-1067]|nr:hypothetical protein FRA_35c07620 [Francisella sp. W12-1067]
MKTLHIMNSLDLKTEFTVHLSGRLKLMENSDFIMLQPSDYGPKEYLDADIWWSTIENMPKINCLDAKKYDRIIWYSHGGLISTTDGSHENLDRTMIYGVNYGKLQASGRFFSALLGYFENVNELVLMCCNSAGYNHIQEPEIQQIISKREANYKDLARNIRNFRRQLALKKVISQEQIKKCYEQKLQEIKKKTMTKINGSFLYLSMHENDMDRYFKMDYQKFFAGLANGRLRGTALDKIVFTLSVDHNDRCISVYGAGSSLKALQMLSFIEDDKYRFATTTERLNRFQLCYPNYLDMSLNPKQQNLLVNRDKLEDNDNPLKPRSYFFKKRTADHGLVFYGRKNEPMFDYNASDIIQYGSKGGQNFGKYTIPRTFPNELPNKNPYYQYFIPN